MQDIHMSYLGNGDRTISHGYVLKRRFASNGGRETCDQASPALREQTPACVLLEGWPWGFPVAGFVFPVGPVDPSAYREQADGYEDLLCMASGDGKARFL